MHNYSLEQAFLFLIFILNGVLVGFLYDIFRVMRKSFKTSDMITYIQDFLFWILTGIITIFFIYKFNNGELRFFVFAGIFSGVAIYLLTMSKIIIKINTIIINKCYKIFYLIYKLFKKIIQCIITLLCKFRLNFQNKVKKIKIL